MIDDIRFCVRCGQPVEYRQTYGRLRPVCSACQHVHFLEPKVATGVLIEQAGQLLLIQRANEPERGKWSIPAGFVDRGEAPARAAEREALEETGLTVRVTHLFDVFAKGAGNDGADIFITYCAEVVSGTVTPGDDAANAQFFGPTAWPELAFTSTKYILERWQNSAKITP